MADRKLKIGKAEVSKTNAGAACVKMGRPRAFCAETALDSAMRVFWAKGYEGASLDDLTAAMGINRSSLYMCFGDKESLFRAVLARYAEGPAAYVNEALERPSARAVVEALLQGAVEMLADPKNPRGCLLLQGGLTCGAGAESVKQTMIERRKLGEVRLEARLQRAKKSGELAADVYPKDLARYVFVLLHGLGVQAASGATRAEMSRAVGLALRGLPV